MNRLAMVVVLLVSSLAARAGDVPEYHLALQGHAYRPTELTIPADTKVRLVIENRDASPEEFESTEFSREKIVLPNSTITVYVGPLKRGSYKFFGDFHPETAQGRLIVE